MCNLKYCNRNAEDNAAAWAPVPVSSQSQSQLPVCSYSNSVIMILIWWGWIRCYEWVLMLRRPQLRRKQSATDGCGPSRPVASRPNLQFSLHSAIWMSRVSRHFISFSSQLDSSHRQPSPIAPAPAPAIAMRCDMMWCSVLFCAQGKDLKQYMEERRNCKSSFGACRLSYRRKLETETTLSRSIVWTVLDPKELLSRDSFIRIRY